MGPTRDYEAALRAQLVQAARRPRLYRHRHRIAVGALGAIAVLATVVVVAKVDSPRPVTTAAATTLPAATGVEVGRAAGRVTVTLTDPGATAPQVQAAVDEAGLDIRVQAEPAGPSKVGRFIGYVETEGAVDDDFIQGDATAFAGFSLPEGWAGRLVLYLGREARADEIYLATSDAYADGEPLACSKTLGQPLTRLEPHIEGYTVRVFTYADGQRRPELTYAEAIGQGLGGETVTKVDRTSPSELTVDLAGPTTADPPFKC